MTDRSDSYHTIGAIRDRAEMLAVEKRKAAALERLADNSGFRPIVFPFILEDGGQLLVTVTEEGVIFDIFDGAGVLVGTVGRMATEWFDYVAGGGNEAADGV